MSLKLYTGFGDPDTQDFARFTVLVPRNTGIVPDWNPAPRIIEDQIVGSSDIEVQVLGFGSATVEHELYFDSRESFYHLQTMLGQKRTLVLLKGYSRFPANVHHILGKDYEYHDDILLTRLVPQMRVGATLARATFLRSSNGLGVSL